MSRHQCIFVLLLISLCLVACKRGSTNELGLSNSDLAHGGPIETQILLERTTKSAETYFTNVADQLRNFADDEYSLKLNLSKVGELRSIGYRSSFYYFCWDIFLPFEFKSKKGDLYLLVAQLSDRTPGNKHDIDQFKVLRIFILDNKGTILQRIENAE